MMGGLWSPSSTSELDPRFHRSKLSMMAMTWVWIGNEVAVWRIECDPPLLVASRYHFRVSNVPIRNRVNTLFGDTFSFLFVVLLEVA